VVEFVKFCSIYKGILFHLFSLLVFSSDSPTNNAPGSTNFWQGDRIAGQSFVGLGGI
jgi:hypothetical protein